MGNAGLNMNWEEMLIGIIGFTLLIGALSFLFPGRRRTWIDLGAGLLLGLMLLYLLISFGEWLRQTSAVTTKEYLRHD